MFYRIRRYYFFDATKAPMFYICYLLNVISLVAVVISFLSIDFMFISVSLYIVGLYQELQFNLRQVSEVMTVKARTAAIVKCIRFHKDILR